MFGGNNKGKRAANKKKGYKHEKGNNLYRIEQLGTRLMMDATVSDWTAESNLIDDNLLPAQYVSSWEDTRIDTVQIEEDSLVRRAQVNDLYDEGDIDTSALEAIVKNSEATSIWFSRILLICSIYWSSSSVMLIS